MPQERLDHKRKGLTGLAKHGTTVSLAPARAVSSHARKIYHERYHSRYRFAQLVFIFDLSLLGIVAILLAFNLTLFIQSYKSASPGLGLEFNAPPLVAADETPLALKVRVLDGKVHDGVNIGWHLPPWIEVIQSNPQIASDGTVYIGTLEPGQDRVSQLLVRIRTQAGSKVPIGFSVTQYDPLMLYLEYSGSETRTVERSALSIEPVFKEASYMSGASVPFVVANDGRLTAHAVSLRLTGHEGAPDAGFGSADSFTVGEMAPGERRLVFVDLGKTTAAAINLKLELQDAAQTVAKKELDLPVTVSGNVEIADAVITADGKLVFDHAAPGASSVLVSCTAITTKKDPYQIIDLSAEQKETELSPVDGQPFRSCSIIPIDRSSGSMVLVSKTEAVAKGALPFVAAARYYSNLGDQLGVGPLPPRVGEATTYWVTWTVGPFDSDLRDVELTTDLPEEVRATGKFASSIPGTFETDGKKITWSFPSLRMVGQEKSVFAFEIEFMPTEKDLGQAVRLLDGSVLTALTLKDGMPVRTEAVGDDTKILTDEKAGGRGMIENK